MFFARIVLPRTASALNRATNESGGTDDELSTDNPPDDPDQSPSNLPTSPIPHIEPTSNTHNTQQQEEEMTLLSKSSKSGDHSAAIEQWCKFIKKCVSTRLDVEKFETYAKNLSTKIQIPKDELATAVISSDAYPTPHLSVDPRYLSYIQRLVSSDIVPLSSLITALLHSDRQENSLDGVGPSMVDGLSREPVDTAILTTLVLASQTLQHGPSNREGVSALVGALSKWMDAVIAAGDGDGLGNALNENSLESLGLGSGVMGPQKKEVVGELVLAVGENQKLNTWLKSNEVGRDKRLNFESTLPMFAQVFQNTNPQLSLRLDSLVPKKVDSATGGTLLGMGLGLDTISAPDGSLGVSCRGGLYIFLNSILFARPLIDDDYILNYLTNRYKELGGPAALDLIVAAFDCLSNAISRSESSATVSLFRHFLVNKIPLLLLRFNIPAITAPFILTQAISKSGSNNLSLEPSFGSTDSMMLDLSNDIKQEFLFACALHRIIEESSIETILGDVPLSTMAKKRYTQEELVNECLVDPERLERLVNEIEELDGNSGAIAGAVVEMIQQLYQQRETVTLHTLCNQLTCRPKTLDLLLLYARPVTILEPLCLILHNWQYEEDQGEFQPVYEEFGYIFLLIITMYYRFNLNHSHLGNITSDNFVLKFLKQCYKDISLDELKKMGDKHNQLNGWIKALYDGDGITDELMQSCKPEDFFNIVPTLFAQTVEACDRTVIDMDTLKGGLEYFQLPFLIASEVSAIFWLTDYLWETSSDNTNALKILHAIITTSPSDVLQTHKTIIAICTQNLERVLKDLLRLDSPPQQVEQILKQLSPYKDFRRSGLPSQSESDSWTKQSGGLLTSLKNSLHSVIMWSTNPELSITPASYTPRLLYTAWKLLGAKEVLKTLVDELHSIITSSTIDGISDIAIDIVSSMISSPNPDDFGSKTLQLTGLRKPGESINSGYLTLSESLKYLEEDLKLNIEESSQKSDIVVKLVRKVEGLLQVGINIVSVSQQQVDLGLGGVNEVLGVDLGDGGDMFHGIQDAVDLGLGDEIMGGM